MNRIRRAALLAAVLISLIVAVAVAACGGGGGDGFGPVATEPAGVSTAAAKAAALTWLAQTNAMWTSGDFAALDQVTTGAMRAVYLAEKRQASLPSNASRQAFRLENLTVVIPCQTGSPGVFVAYGDTDVFSLGAAMRPMAMVFQRAGGRWKLAAAVSHPDRGWPVLCTGGPPPAAPPVLAPADYAPQLARVLTHALTGAAETAASAAPFAVNGFFAGHASVNAQAARQAERDRRGGVSLTGRFTPTAYPTLMLPLAGGRGYWVIGVLTQRGRYASAAGLRAGNWPDGNQVAAPRPAVVHEETDTFLTTYTAVDPPRPAGGPVPHGGRVTLDGFFGWPLTAVAR
jgi:hypothetical protein